MKARQKALRMQFLKALRALFTKLKAPPSLKLGNMTINLTRICNLSRIISIIAILLIFFQALLIKQAKINNRQKYTKLQYCYEIYTEFQISQNDNHYLDIFKKIEIQLQYFILQLIAYQKFFFSIFDIIFLQRSFRFYYNAEQHYKSLKIQVAYILNQLQKNFSIFESQYKNHEPLSQQNDQISKVQSFSLNSSSEKQHKTKQVHFKTSSMQSKQNKNKMRTSHYFILVILLMIASPPLIQATSCNSFPKIFGGSLENSYLTQIDVYDDYLAMAGDTKDNSLTGVSGQSGTLPFILLQSIALQENMYWGKVFAQKAYQTIIGVQFSGDGQLLIAHSFSISSFIIVIKTPDGSILSARSYQDKGHWNYNDQVKSMIVSSGATPMAYVLSNYQTYTISGQLIISQCKGQHFIKFDPKTYSNTPLWIKQTQGSSFDNCGHLGLTFGRSEQFIYTFSWFEKQSVVSLVDSSGYPKWQYATPGGYQFYSNIIQYKEIDADTDMVIATSGNSQINYNRIISSCDSPHSVSADQSKIFFDPASTPTRQLRGLYIIDLNQAVALIFDKDSHLTQLATINFQTPSISYQPAFPNIQFMTNVVFKSQTIFYGGGYDIKFYRDQSNSYTFNPSKFQTFVYSSNISSSNCYSMSSSAASGQITLSTQLISSLSSSIYESSTETFIQDNEAYKTFDIQQSKQTRVSWCQILPFTVNDEIQSTSDFTVYVGGSVDQFFSISQFSATINCGAYQNTWTYKGYSKSEVSELNYAIDFMSVNQSSGEIKIAPTKPANTYYINITGILPDQKTMTFALFTIKVIQNSLPLFQPSLNNVAIPINSLFNYTIPSITDVDGQQTNISSVKESQSGSLPSFITQIGSILVIKPDQMNLVKIYTMIVIISDTIQTNEFSFQLEVINKPPLFNQSVLTPVVLNIGDDIVYQLPNSYDPEGLPYWVKIQNESSIVSLLTNTSLRINATNCAKDFSDQIVNISLEDQQPKSTVYPLNISIINKPPVFQSSSLQNQVVQLKYIEQYELPQFLDPEGCPVVVTIQPLIVSQFVQIAENGKIIKFAPTLQNQVGSFDITVILTDSQGLSSNKSFNLIVYQVPIFLGSLTKQIDLIASKQASYTLPVSPIAVDESIVHTSPLPSFVSFSFPEYTFEPNKISDLGLYVIQGNLKNLYTQTQFSFKINVTNDAPYLESGKVPDQKVQIGQSLTFVVESGKDRENQDISYQAQEKSQTTLPLFVKFDSTKKEFTCMPTKLDASAKDYEIELILKDSFGAQKTYSFFVIVSDDSIQNANNQQNQNSYSSNYAGKSNTFMVPKQKNSKALNNNSLPVTKGFLSAKIKSINPFGLISIKFFEELDTPLFINNASLKFNLTNIDIQLKPFLDQSEQILNKSITKWEAINLTSTEMIIQVNFSDPAKISPKITQEDKIEIKIKDGELFRSLKGQKFLPDNYILMTGLPRQIVLSKQIKTIYEMVTGGSKTMTYILIVNIAFQLFSSFSMHLLWGMMNNLQLIDKMLKFNIDVPSNAYIFFKYVDEFLNLNSKFVEEYLEKFNQYLLKTTETSAESEKDQNTSIIKNLGTIIIGFVVLVLAMISTALLIKFSRIPMIIMVTDALKNKLFYNSILRISVQSYLQFCIIAFSQLDSKKDNTTLATGIVILVLTLSFLFFTHIFLRKNLTSLSDPNFQQKFDSLYLNIETSVPHSYLLTTIFLFRRFLLGIILNFCDNRQDVQFFYMNFTSFLIIIYLVKVKPLVSNYLNSIELFNEVILYGCTGLIWGMTDYQGDNLPGVTSEQINSAYNSKQDQIGWAYIIMASSTIVTAIGGVFINFLILIKIKLQEKCSNKAIKEQIQQQLPTKSSGYAKNKQDDSTYIQNSSVVSEINHKNDRDFKVFKQERNSEFFKQVEEEIKQIEHLFPLQNPQNHKKTSPGSLKDNKHRLKNSILLTSSESQQNFEEIKDALSNKKVNSKAANPKKKKKPLIKDAFVISEVEQNKIKESSYVPENIVWLNKDYPQRKLIYNQIQR